MRCRCRLALHIAAATLNSIRVSVSSNGGRIIRKCSDTRNLGLRLLVFTDIILNENGTVIFRAEISSPSPDWRVLSGTSRLAVFSDLFNSCAGAVTPCGCLVFRARKKGARWRSAPRGARRRSRRMKCFAWASRRFRFLPLSFCVCPSNFLLPFRFLTGSARTHRSRGEQRRTRKKKKDVHKTNPTSLGSSAPIGGQDFLHTATQRPQRLWPAFPDGGGGDHALGTALIIRSERMRLRWLCKAAGRAIVAFVKASRNK